MYHLTPERDLFFFFITYNMRDAERFDANLGGCKADKNQRKIERDGACMCALCNANARKQKTHKIIMKKKTHKPANFGTFVCVCEFNFKCPLSLWFE
uniref:Uncharacterized protein n=1 Tax=Gossypium raimondii TaxID=29730 RepID=A0A0D2UP47_GOSRA|nr:hypothetical protein B456_011G049600 [Gossypium raimondii]